MSYSWSIAKSPMAHPNLSFNVKLCLWVVKAQQRNATREKGTLAQSVCEHCNPREKLIGQNNTVLQPHTHTLSSLHYYITHRVIVPKRDKTNALNASTATRARCRLNRIEKKREKNANSVVGIVVAQRAF